MEAIEFLKEYRRMCSASDDHCGGCPLKEEGCLSTGMRVKSDSKFLRITCAVEQWSKEHPIMTNAKKFKEIFGVTPENAEVPYRGRSFPNWWDEPYKEPDIEHVSYDAEQLGREK